ncbi:MAG: acyltransferase family protein [Clostridiales bacterium]|nr:acyltransferase family protein [Clostridiales bacterium]
MIDFLPVALVILLIINMRVVKPLNATNEDCLSREASQYYRGFFALVVVLHHLSQKAAEGVFFPVFLHAGSLAVSFFFFLSGYGLQKSFMAKPEIYRKNYLKKRIPAVLIPYVVFVFIYWLVNAVVGKRYSISDICIGFVNGSPIVSYSWYIIVILVFYLFFGLFMFLCRKKPKMTVLYGCAWYIVWVLFCYKTDYNIWWYSTAHLLLLGMIWATYEIQINRIIKKHYVFLALVSWIGFILLFALQDIIIPLLPHQFIATLLWQFLLSLLFVCGVLFLFRKMIIGNQILGFLGGISLEIYLVHGLYIQIIQIQNAFVWCLSVISLSLVTAYLLHIVLSYVLKKYRNMMHL